MKQKNLLQRKIIKAKDLSRWELILQNFKVYKKTGIALDLLSALRQTLINNLNP